MFHMQLLHCLTSKAPLLISCTLIHPQRSILLHLALPVPSTMAHKDVAHYLTTGPSQHKHPHKTTCQANRHKSVRIEMGGLVSQSSIFIPQPPIGCSPLMVGWVHDTAAIHRTLNHYLLLCTSRHTVLLQDLSEEGVPPCVLEVNPLLRVEHHHLLQQVGKHQHKLPVRFAIALQQQRLEVSFHSRVDDQYLDLQVSQHSTRKSAHSSPASQRGILCHPTVSYRHVDEPNRSNLPATHKRRVKSQSTVAETE